MGLGLAALEPMRLLGGETDGEEPVVVSGAMAAGAAEVLHHKLILSRWSSPRGLNFQPNPFAGAGAFPTP